MKIYKLSVPTVGDSVYSFNQLIPLHVGLQKNSNVPVVWAKVTDDDENRPVEFYTFRVYMTGEDVGSDWEYCGTFQLREPYLEEFVGHIFMRRG